MVWEREHIFPQESYKCFTSKAFLQPPSPTLVTSKVWCYRWWVSCLLRCGRGLEHRPFLHHPFSWSISLLRCSKFDSDIHTLSRPDICSEPYSHSGKNTEPRGRFDSAHVKSMGDLQMQDEIAAQKLCISGLRCTWFLHFKVPLEAWVGTGSGGGFSVILLTTKGKMQHYTPSPLLSLLWKVISEKLNQFDRALLNWLRSVNHQRQLCPLLSPSPLFLSKVHDQIPG